MIEMVNSPEYVKMYNIAERIIKNNYQVIDNHTGEPLMHKPVGLAINNSGEVGLLMDCNAYCLNEVYVADDESVHLSTRSIGSDISSTLDVADYNSRYVFRNDRISDVLYLRHVAPLIRR